MRWGSAVMWGILAGQVPPADLRPARGLLSSFAANERDTKIALKAKTAPSGRRIERLGAPPAIP